MKKIAPKGITYKKWEEFTNAIRQDSDWINARRWGWGLGPKASERIKEIKDDPKPLFLKIIDEIPSNMPTEKYVVISDKAKFAITVYEGHLKDFFKKWLPDFEPEI